MDHSDPSPLYETALGTAVLNGKPQVVRLLLAGGADVERKDSYGQTALDLANVANDDGIFLMLKKASKKRVPAKVFAGSH
jgi:ankyrin repeat protein